MRAGKNILKFLSLKVAMKSNRALLKAACCMLAATVFKRIRETSGGLHTTVACMSSGTYTTLEFVHKTSCAIAYTRCYKLVRIKPIKLIR